MENYMEYKGYIGTVSFNANDEVFYGKIHGITDLVTFEGQSVKELKKAFKDAVDDYLETCSALGKEPNKTFKGTFNVRLTAELHQKAAIAALRKSLSLNDFVKKAISFAVDHQNTVTAE
ncbi:MAG: type II toxin-antitoxin system HicB family antitoxin [Chitinophagales bacterium]|nr:type II toxin-antitoxin system HicB family antitoxin [Chitinophagales bacterium]